jgi:hypothetical protein
MRSLGVVVVILAVHWFAIEALWAKAKVRDGCRVYSAPTGLRILCFITIPSMWYGTVANYIENPGERWVSVLLFAVSLLILYFFPSTILVCDEQIMAIKWFGLKRISMTWDEVEAIYRVPEERSIVVQDKQQSQIAHSMFNIDRAGFLRQVSAIPQATSGRITLRL